MLCIQNMSNKSFHDIHIEVVVLNFLEYQLLSSRMEKVLEVKFLVILWRDPDDGQ